MTKAQVDVVSLTLIVILAIVLAGTIYVWLQPLIKKRQDTIKVGRLLEDFNPNNPESLPRKIEYVAKTEAEVGFEIDSDGIWLLSPAEDFIKFFTFSKVSNVAVAEEGVGWVSLTPGVACPTPLEGRIGEAPYGVCVRADRQADGFNLTYNVMFRGLKDPLGKVHKIDLERWTETSPLTSTERRIRIKFGGVKVEDEKILTKVLILLF